MVASRSNKKRTSVPDEGNPLNGIVCLTPGCSCSRSPHQSSPQAEEEPKPAGEPLASGVTTVGQSDTGGTFDYEGLCPGIRECVRFLHSHGFDTCDSGDGSNHAAGMEGAMEEPMVAMMTTSARLIADTIRCGNLLAPFGVPLAAVQGTYCPDDSIPMIIVVHENLKKVRP